MIRLKILIPNEVLVEADVDKVVAESTNGSFCLLPRHIDFAAPIVPGILSYTVGNEESFVATDTGLLTKIGDEVLVSVQRAVQGPSLESLDRTVRDHFRRLDSDERAVRQALDRLEADVMRRFVEMHQEAHS